MTLAQTKTQVFLDLGTRGRECGLILRGPSKGGTELVPTVSTKLSRDPASLK